MFIKCLKHQGMYSEFGGIKEIIISSWCAFGVLNFRLKKKLVQDSKIFMLKAIDLILA